MRRFGRSEVAKESDGGGPGPCEIAANSVKQRWRPYSTPAYLRCGSGRSENSIRAAPSLKLLDLLDRKGLEALI